MALSKGAIASIMATRSSSLQATVQIFNIKSLPNQGDKPARYRFSVTDGVDVANAMASTQLAVRIKAGEIVENSIVTLTNYQVNLINSENGLIIVILDCEMISQINNFFGPVGRTNLPPPETNAPQIQAYAPPPLHQVAHQSNLGQSHTITASQAPPVYGQSFSVPMANPNYQHMQPPVHAPVVQPSIVHSNSVQQHSHSSYPPHGMQPMPNAYSNIGRPVIKDDPQTGPIVPISAINPYSSKWTIKARVTSKSDLKHWSNAKGEGTLFSIDLLDSNGGEIRGTFFKEAATKFFPVIMEGQVYTFSGGVLKIVQNRQYTTIKNQYEITFNQNSEIKAASEDSAIKSMSFNFVKLNSIGTLEVGSTIDVIAIVRQASDVSDIVSTKLGGKSLKKRDLQLIDDSGFEIKLTLWGDKAVQEQNWGSQPILAIKGVKIGDYGGRSLSSLNSSSTFYEFQSVPEYHQLSAWRSNFPGGVQAGSSYSSAQPGSAGGGNESFDKRKTMASIKEEGMGMADKPDYIVLKGSVVYIKHDNDPWYTACPTDQCNKKVNESLNSEWFCEKCNKTFPQCNRRYILTISMSDHSGSAWFSLFNETAEKLLGHSAQQMYELKSSDPQLYEKVYSDALFKTVVVKARVKQEIVNDEPRTKSSIIKIDSLDLVTESKNMIDAINKYH